MSTNPNHWTFDACDAEWENPNTGRTVYRPGLDDDYCEHCDTDQKGCSCE